MSVVENHSRTGSEGVRVICVDGPPDIDAARDLSAELAEAATGPARSILVDISSMPEVNPMFVSALLNGSRRVARMKRRIALVCDDGDLLHVLEVAGLACAFAIYESRAQAAAALTSW